MKIRSGFVSNSSSSSFIVAFPKDLEINEENVKNEFFPHMKWDQRIVSPYGDESLTVAEACESIVGQMKDQEGTDAMFLNDFRYGQCPPFLQELSKALPDYYAMREMHSNMDHQEFWHIRDLAVKTWEAKVWGAMNELADKNGWKWFGLQYSDGGGIGETNPAMERGGAFDELIQRDRAMMFNNH